MDCKCKQSLAIYPLPPEEERGDGEKSWGIFPQNVGVNPLGPSLMMPVDAVGVRARSSKANKGTIDCWMQALKAYLL